MGVRGISSVDATSTGEKGLNWDLRMVNEESGSERVEGQAVVSAVAMRPRWDLKTAFTNAS